MQQVYKSVKQLVVRYKTCHQHRLQENNSYLLLGEDRMVREVTGFAFLEIILIITQQQVLHQIYNHGAQKL